MSDQPNRVTASLFDLINLTDLDRLLRDVEVTRTEAEDGSVILTQDHGVVPTPATALLPTVLPDGVPPSALVTVPRYHDDDDPVVTRATPPVLVAYAAVLLAAAAELARRS